MAVDDGHLHDNRYFRQDDVLRRLALKSNTTHTHADGSLLPNGTVTGDFLRWDGDSWAVASEPITLTQLNLTPALVAALDIEGGMFYNSTDKSVYVCTDI